MEYLKKIMVLLSFCLWVLTQTALAQNIPQALFYKNYSKKEYNASTQNWAMVQSQSHIMYFANNLGVLEFDGRTWDLFEMPNRSIVRSLHKIGTDSIMVGAYAEFGLLYKTSTGKLGYESWLNKIPKEYQNIDEIWKIYASGDKLYVQSFNYLFVFKNKKLAQVIQPKTLFKYSFLIDGKLYIQEINRGLYELKNEKLQLVPNGLFYADKEIWAMLPYAENKLLIGTQLNGLFIYDGNINKEWQCESNSFIKENDLYSAIKMRNGNFVFGTIQNGLIISNQEGHIINFQNTTLGLQNNTVLSLFEDKAGNLWSGLDNGIDYIITNSALSYVRKRGGFGTGYSSIIHNKALYVGTNQGLFKLPLSNNKHILDADFELIESTRGQVWRLIQLDNQLFCAHNSGLFKFKDNRVEKIGVAEGIWDMVPIPDRPNEYLVGTYAGFYIYNIKKNTLEKVNGFNESSRKFFFRKKELWLSHGYKGLYALTLDAANRSIKVNDLYNESNRLPSDFSNDIYQFDNSLLATTIDGIYEFTGSGFEKNTRWDKLFDNGPLNITNLIRTDETTYWCFINQNLNEITYLSEEMYENKKRVFLPISNTFPRTFENITKLNSDEYLIGNEDGFILYNSNQAISDQEALKIDLKSIEYQDKRQMQSFNIPFKKNKNNISTTALNYKMRFLTFTFSLPYYSNQDLVQIRYKVNDAPWSLWQSNNQIYLNNIKEGEFKLRVQATIDQQVIENSIELNFEIYPPIYRTIAAYAFYLISIIIITLIIIRLTRRKIEHDRRRELLKQQKKMIENEIKLKKKAQIAEGELIKLRNEKLRVDIRHKSKELANTTMTIINKNKLLREFKEVLVTLKKEDVRYQDNKQINGLIKKINREIDHQDNWTVFEKNFDKVHENFLKRLKQKHHALTPKDLRLAAYLRMNLSSKEIAPLLNISVRSVEISRYRLRKKMELDNKQNLIEYIISI